MEYLFPWHGGGATQGAHIREKSRGVRRHLLIDGCDKAIYTLAKRSKMSAGIDKIVANLDVVSRNDLRSEPPRGIEVGVRKSKIH